MKLTPEEQRQVNAMAGYNGFDAAAYLMGHEEYDAAFDAMMEVLQIAAVLLQAPQNRFGRPDFCASDELRTARESLRELALRYETAAADTVLHQCGKVCEAVLAKLPVWVQP